MELKNIFEYDPVMQVVAENMLASRDPHYFESSGERYRGSARELLSLVWDIFTPETLKQFEGVARRPVHPAIVLYYLLMGLRKLDNTICPPHDISLLTANLVQAQYTPSRLLLGRAGMLPSLVLLASIGWELMLPLWSGISSKALRQMLPENKITFTSPGLKNQADNEDGYILLTEARHMASRRQVDFEEQRNAAGAFILDSWDFLGVKSNEHSRRFWLDKSALTGVLQLPRLKRQAWNLYSTLLQCKKNVPPIIRMANAESALNESGILDQRLALGLMLDPPDNISSLDVSKSEIEQEPSCNLTPTIWLRKSNMPEIEGLRLGECAQIIRCQLPRKKFKESGVQEYGLQTDGTHIVREVGMAALQSESGFLMAESGDQVKIDFKRSENMYKYILRKNDIIFSFRGTQDSLGKVGFVNQDPEMPTITGPAFCIIRTLSRLDPIWLYWFLQTEEARSNILTRSSGTSLLNIGTDDIKNLVIREPETKELDRIRDFHEKITVEINTISESIRQLRVQTSKLKKALQR